MVAMGGEIWHFKWIHSFEHKNPSVSLQFHENFLYSTSFRFPVLTITVSKLNFMWFHWNHSIFFLYQTWFQKPFRYFCWFQHGFIETILVSKRDFGPKMTKDEVSITHQNYSCSRHIFSSPHESIIVWILGGFTKVLAENLKPHF